MRQKLYRTALKVAAIAGATLPFRALAIEPPPAIPGLSGDEGADGIFNAIVDVLVIILDFVALLAVVFIVIAGIRLVISGGDEGEKDKAKKTIIYVIAGLIVIIFARTIVVFVLDSIGGG